VLVQNSLVEGAIVSKHILWVRKVLIATFLFFIVGFFLFSQGCESIRTTDHLKIWEGPPLNYGRMAASLGAVLLRDGRIVVAGGSPTEHPFIAHKGLQSIEIADKKCVLSAECIQAREKCTCWKSSGIDVPYRMAGAMYPLPDGRLILFSSTFVIDPDSNRLEPESTDKNVPNSGSVAAIIIDIDRKIVTPIYRPHKNKMGLPSLKKRRHGFLTSTGFCEKFTAQRRSNCTYWR